MYPKWVLVLGNFQEFFAYPNSITPEQSIHGYHPKILLEVAFWYILDMYIRARVSSKCASADMFFVPADTVYLEKEESVNDASEDTR